MHRDPPDFWANPEPSDIGRHGPWSRRHAIAAWAFVAVVAILAIVEVVTQA